MRYNTANQRFVCVAIDSNGFVASQAENITGTIAIDNGTPAAISDTNPTELGYGRYAFDLTQAETAGYELVFVLNCTTTGVDVVGDPGDVVYTSRELEILTSEGVAVARLRGTTINVFTGETHNYALTTDDYTAKTLVMVFEENDKTDVATIADGALTKAAASVTFAIPAAVTASARSLQWSLRDSVNGDEVLMYGRVSVRDAALTD